MSNTDENWDKLFEQMPLDLTPSEDHQINLKASVLKQFDVPKPSPVSRSITKRIGRIIMKYKVPHWTAAAALITCMIWISQFSSPAFAVEDVVEHILEASNAQWDMIVKNEGNEDQKIRVYLDSGHTRQEFENGMIVIVDFNKGQSLGLFADDKIAIKSSVAKMSDNAMKYDHFEKMREELREAMMDPNKNVEKLGVQQIDGQKLIGFRFKSKSLPITIWADLKTAFPVRIVTDISKTSQVVMMNYVFNSNMEPSLFSLEVPSGYRIMDEGSPISAGGEQDLIQSLRMYADSSEGEFPDSLDEDGINKANSQYLNYIVKRDKTAQVQRSPEDQGEEFLRLMKGFTFANGLSLDEKWDAHYAGSGVKLDTPNRPIFWYKPESTEKYRIIYADLSVRSSLTIPEQTGVKIGLPK